MRMRLLKTGACNGAFNMAVDEAVMLSLMREESLPTLRLYRWDPPCLSVGYFQDAQKEVDFESLSAMGFSMVRRITGGKAVLHDDEVTYSVVIPEALLPGGVLETYREICRGIIRGLEILGVRCEMTSSDHRDRLPGAFPRAACFSAPSWYEVVASGRKIVGSAQCRKNGVILQHGSIPLSFSPERVARCFKVRAPEGTDRLASLLSERASSLGDVLGRKVRPEEVEDCLCAGFREELGWEMEEDGLSASELLDVCRLVSEKYGSAAWNMSRGKVEEDGLEPEDAEASG